MRIPKTILSLALSCGLAFAATGCHHLDPDQPIDPNDPNEPTEQLYGNALSLNGTTDYVYVAHADDLSLSSGSFTVEAWVKPGSTTYYKWIAAKAVNNSQLDYMLGFDSDGAFRFITRSLYNDIKGRVPEANRWYHVVGVQDAEAQKVYLYVDGKLESSAPLGGVSGENTSQLLLGVRIHTHYPGVLAEYLDGTVDEVRIWNKALSCSDIQQHLCTPKSVDPHDDNIVAYWKFDEASGTAVIDASGRGHTGVSTTGHRVVSTVPGR